MRTEISCHPRCAASHRTHLQGVCVWMGPSRQVSKSEIAVCSTHGNACMYVLVCMCLCVCACVCALVCVSALRGWAYSISHPFISHHLYQVLNCTFGVCLGSHPLCRIVCTQKSGISQAVAVTVKRSFARLRPSIQGKTICTATACLDAMQHQF